MSSAKPLGAVSLTSVEGALPAGRWMPRSMLGGPAASPVLVGDGGALGGYVPLRVLAPRHGYLFELVAAPAAHPPRR